MFPTFLDEASDMAVRAFGTQPLLNIYEKDNSIFVEAELPGFNLKDIEITITGDQLKITGKSRVTNEENEDKKNRRYFITEISEKSFTRTVTLPYEVIAENAKATFKDGMLKLEVPKSEKAIPKTIKVEMDA